MPKPITKPEPVEPEIIYAADRPQGDQVDPRLELLARLMDSVFRVPGSGIQFGLDALVGLIPGFGDTASSLVALYILNAASRYGVPRIMLVRMALNIAIDFAGGSIPIAGDIFDVYWKANQKNVALLRRHLLTSPAEERRALSGDWLFVAGLSAGLILLLIGSVALALFLLTWIGERLVGQLWRYGSRFRNLPDDPARIAGGKHAFGDVPGDDAPRPDDRFRSDFRSRADDRTASHPHAGADFDGFAEFLVAAQFGVHRMSRGIDLDSRPEEGKVANLDEAHVEHHAVEVEEHPLAQQDVRPIVAKERRLHPDRIAPLCEQVPQDSAASLLLSLARGV